MTAAAMSAYRMLSELGYVLGPTLLGIAAQSFGIRASLLTTAGGIVLLGLAFGYAAPETYRRSPTVVPVGVESSTAGNDRSTG